MATQDREQALLRGLAAWDAAWTSQDADALRKVLAPDAVMHADGVLFQDDLQGSDAIHAVHARYFDRFQYEHEVIASAVNPGTNSAFAFWQDSGAGRRAERGGEDVPPEPLPGTTMLGIWKLCFDADAHLVTQIWFLRQLHREEAGHRLRDPGAVAHGHSDAFAHAGTAIDASPDLKAEMRRATERFSEIWHTGDVSIADEILAEDVEEADLTQGMGLQGKEAFKAMIKGLWEHWRPDSFSIDVGVAPDRNVAMVHWAAEGEMEGAGGGRGGRTVHQYGLTVLVFDPVEAGNVRIKRIAGFRQLSPPERERMLRDDAFVRTEAALGAEK